MDADFCHILIFCYKLIDPRKIFFEEKDIPKRSKKILHFSGIQDIWLFYINFRSNFYIFVSEVLHIPLRSGY